MKKFNKGLAPLSGWCDSERHNRCMLRFVFPGIAASIIWAF